MRRARRRTAASLRQQAGILLLALGLAGSALAFGAQQTLPLVLSAVAAIGAAALLPLSRTPRTAWVLAGLAAYALLQLLPLPAGLVARLSPHTAAVWRDALVPFGASPPAWLSLSVEPAATALEVLKWSAYACLFSAAVSLRSRHGSEPLAFVVLGSALLVGVVTLAHGILDAERVYGFFQSPNASRWTRGPFINGNNLSGYLNLGVFAGAGLWLARRGRTRVLVGLAVLTLAVGSLLAGSRGGTLALALGVPAFALVAFQLRNQPKAGLTTALVTITLAGIALAGMLGQSRIWETFGDTQMRAKVSAWRWTLGMIADFPVFGVGRGAFETAFQPYRGSLGNDWTMVFAHAENFVLEWIAEWGTPVAVAALLALGMGLRRIAGHALRSPVAAGLATGIFVLLFQNLADFGLEIYAVMALAVVAFAGATPPVPLTEQARPWGVLTALAALGAVIVVATRASPVQAERRHEKVSYDALSHAKRSELVAFQRGLEPVVRRHPGEAYFPLLGGLAASRLGRSPLPWLGRALERSPLDARVHLALYDALAARGAGRQAVLHARLAALYDNTLRPSALQRIARATKTAADVSDAFPERLPGAELLAELCTVLPPERSLDCWREAARRSPSFEAQRGLATALVDALERVGSSCSGAAAAACSAEASATLLERPGEQTPVRQWQMATLRARLIAWQGDPARAAATLLEHCPATNEAAACCDQALELAARSRNLDAIATAAARYAAVLCGDPVTCGAVHERVGRIYAAIGAQGLALAQFTRAAEQAPGVERWLLAAEAAAAANSNVAAQVAIERALKEGVDEPSQKQRLANVQLLLLERSR